MFSFSVDPLRRSHHSGQMCTDDISQQMPFLSQTGLKPAASGLQTHSTDYCRLSGLMPLLNKLLLLFPHFIPGWINHNWVYVSGSQTISNRKNEFN